MKENKLSEALFILAYTLWLIANVCLITLWGDILFIKDVCKYLQNFAYILLILKFVLKERYGRKDIICIFIIVFCCIVSGNSVYNKHILPTCIFMYSAVGIDYKKILKITFIIQALIMLITITASQIGIIEDVVWGENDRLRHGLGYDYCAYPAHLLLFMSLMWLCIRKKVFLIDSIILLAVNYIIFILTNSRTDFLLVILAILGAFIWAREYRVKIVNRIREYIHKYAFVIIAISSIALHKLYDYPYGKPTELMERLNNVLNYRLWMGLRAIYDYGFSLFGKKIRWYGMGSLQADPTRKYNYVDCAYLKEILSFGIVFLILLAIGYYMLGRRINQEKMYMLGWAIVITLIYGILNAHLCVLTFNVFCIAFSLLFEDENNKIKEA